MECKGFDKGTGYVFIAMDPATSGMTWEQVQARAEELAAVESPTVVNDVLYVAPWGKEDAPAKKADHISMCKRETLLLAQQALAPQAPTTVTLSL